MAALTTFVLILHLLVVSLSQHAWYSFNTTEKNFDNFTSYLRWTETGKVDVYLATQFWTGCSAGYFGGQLHSNGDHSVLFSMWDTNSTIKNSIGVSPWCNRFGGEGEGAQCGLMITFEFGVEYRFTLTKNVNASGVLWSASVTKEASPHTTFPLGTIFINVTDLPHSIEECSVLGPSAVSFQEFYLGYPIFYNAADWRGPYLNHNPDMQIQGLAPIDASGDCGNATYPSNVSSTVPFGPAGPPNAYFQGGGHTVHGCEKSMWRHSANVTIKERPFHCRPTAIGATGVLPATVVI